MRLASFLASGRTTWGIVQGEFVYDVGALFPELVDLKAMIAASAYQVSAREMTRARRYTLSEIQWLPVIPNPGKILCVGVNYEDHRHETGRAAVAHPAIFSRFANTQTAHLENIVRPRVSTNLDYEGELALVIGKRGRYIQKKEAFGHIAGYGCYNDGSVRDWQHHTHQFTPGKNFPSTGGFGPWIVTADELGDLSELRITTRLNGQTVQEAKFAQMIFDIPTIIEYCSCFNPLECGDVILTGTPGGVGARRVPPLWMKPGDLVEVEIERLGTLTNGICDEP